MKPKRLDPRILERPIAQRLCLILRQLRRRASQEASDLLKSRPHFPLLKARAATATTSNFIAERQVKARDQIASLQHIAAADVRSHPNSSSSIMRSPSPKASQSCPWGLTILLHGRGYSGELKSWRATDGLILRQKEPLVSVKNQYQSEVTRGQVVSSRHIVISSEVAWRGIDDMLQSQ
ncbi:uncharacterized protein MYCFIDRAFT_173160 [Pseudocercospora fijiensis CIRAD86]|uniref:Uncharacterized protein n=1 Tax=Pseudocercospora fijiensis (strain CIRAD86) TaxID=383855 RepID=M3B427_PSEFD|nr:uncharacterized protein MYCFIDRAFT_173160 [Pseudocercospora fijiensis CIRAD86]EME84112.1 hypothetical protein MYCFIDRAFT_173160 [Pseudocercospora fijiensis CIRAD86]